MSLLRAFAHATDQDAATCQAHEGVFVLNSRADTGAFSQCWRHSYRHEATPLRQAEIRLKSAVQTEASDTKQRNPEFVSAVARALSMLECFTSDEAV